jgi:hypothetical protein
MSLIKSYLSVLNEDKKSFTSTGVAANQVGELEGAKEKAHPSIDPTENVKDLETPVDGPSQEDVTAEDSKPKAIKKESSNPFDVLYNKVLAQENWELEEQEEEDAEAEDAAKADDVFAGVDAVADDKVSDDEEVGLEHVLNHLKNAIEALEKLVSGANNDLTDDIVGEEDAGEEIKQEAVEAEVEGTALEDEEKLNHGLTKQGSRTVKGAVPAPKKAASVDKGKKVDGKPVPFKPTTDLTSPKNHNVGGVENGKFLFA